MTASDSNRSTSQVDASTLLCNEFVEAKHLDGVGGCRGVFARVDIQPGTLILSEKPLITVPMDKADEETLHFALARAVFQHPDSCRLMDSLSVLHPTSLSALPQAVLETITQQHTEDVNKLLQLMQSQAKTETATSDINGNHASEDRERVLRLLLALRFNAHPSGIYLQSEMFNHGCCPNAIKLATTTGSHIRALKPVSAGEQVTISYLDPPLQSYARRCALLQEQHFFTPDPSSFPYPDVMEEWKQPEVAQAEHEQQQQLDSMESQLDSLEMQARYACVVLARGVKKQLAAEKASRRAAAQQAAEKAGEKQSMPQQETVNPGQQHQPVQLQDEVAQLLGSACQTRRKAAALLHPQHIVLARIHELLILLCTALLSAWSLMPTTSSHKSGQKRVLTPQASEPARNGVDSNTSEVRQTWLPAGLDLSIEDFNPNQGNTPANQPLEAADVALLLLQAGLELRATQELYCGPAHYDAARTLLDIHQAIEFLLSHAPKRLYAAMPKDFRNFGMASRSSHRHKLDHERIAALYQ